MHIYLIMEQKTLRDSIQINEQSVHESTIHRITTNTSQGLSRIDLREDHCIESYYYEPVGPNRTTHTPS